MKHKKPSLEPAIIVIFGITGDLAKRKLLPALYHLVKDGLLHNQTEIVGVTRGGLTLDELMSNIELCVNEEDGVCDPAAVKKLLSRLTLHRMNVTKSEDYAKLLTLLDSIEEQNGVCMNRLYYLSIPPNVAQPIVSFLGSQGLNKSCKHESASTRLLIEKPFGYDLDSAHELITETNIHFKEEQVFRIDHYLAKETVQNILTFRFNNPIFEPLWNAEHVEHIEVFALEKVGIEGRANFYEQTGALRDLIQSHLLQVLALITMEKPDSLTNEEIHKNKLAVMQQMIAVSRSEVEHHAIRGQYSGYKTEAENADSFVETYAAIATGINNDRWRNVPVIVRTGKALKEKISGVNIVFKPTRNSPHHNVLTFRIQPNEGISLSLRVKTPGFDDEMQPADMDFSYTRTFSDHQHPDAYERVLVDAVRGDHTLFSTNTEVIESWRVVQAVLDEWAKSSIGLLAYKKGSRGPDVSSLYPSK